MLFCGGKIVAPDSHSRLRKRFKSKKFLVRSSSRNSASQLSCSVSISSFNKSRCSSVRLDTHFCLSNFDDADAEAVAAIALVLFTSLAKNDLMEALPLLVGALFNFFEPASLSDAEAAFDAPESCVASLF